MKKAIAVNNTKKTWEQLMKIQEHNYITLGSTNTNSLVNDPKHLLFTLSRYKFAAKMLRSCRHIVEVGCGEGIGTLMFHAETRAKITAIDFDKDLIGYAKNNVLPYCKQRVKFINYDMIKAPYKRLQSDGFVCIDVIEHIHSREEANFFLHCAYMLKKNGVAVFGTPNKHAHKYASINSKKGHINNFNPERFTGTLEKYFRRVFLFSMNDEVVHTGFSKMAHYLIALCVK